MSNIHSITVLCISFIISLSRVKGENTVPDVEASERKWTCKNETCPPHQIITDDTEPNNIETYSGRAVTMHCIFEGKPKPTTFWMKNGRPFTIENRKNGEIMSIKKDFGLYLENLTPSDSGNYTCVARNSAGRTSVTYRLNVEHVNAFPPRFDAKVMKSQRVFIGSNVSMECRFQSDFAVLFNWQRQDNSTQNWILLQNETTVDPALDPHFYNITSVSLEDAGLYRCWAKNIYGADYQEIELTIDDPAAAKVVAQIIPRNRTVDLAMAAATFVAVAIIVVLYFKARQYRKNRITVVHAEQSFIIRKVVLEHDNTGKCLSPRVKIETETVNLNQLGSAEKKRALNEYQEPLDKEWEVARETLQFGEKLGEGAFGVVYKATARGLRNRTKDDSLVEVAVKMLKDSHTDTDLRNLVSEMEVMKKVGRHLNIVNLLAACTVGMFRGELMVIVEYCAFGNLRHYLLNNRHKFVDQINSETGLVDVNCRKRIAEYVNVTISRPENEKTEAAQPETITTCDLICYAFQVARGMEYLSSRKLIHRDLAARNVLLAEENVVKICDFGLAKDCKYEEYVKKSDGPLPVKWMALESIRDRVFNTKSDVWSFAVMCWEFFSLGSTPYPGVDADEEFYRKLRMGYRMEQPQFCPNSVWNIVTRCWDADPSLRPHFSELSHQFGHCLEGSVYQHYLDLNDPYQKMNRICFSSDDYVTIRKPETPECEEKPIEKNEAPIYDFPVIRMPESYLNDSITIIHMDSEEALNEESVDLNLNNKLQNEKQVVPPKGGIRVMF